MPILDLKQYGTNFPVPEPVQAVLDALNELLAVNPHFAPSRLHCASQQGWPDGHHEWAFGSNFEEGCDSLIYTEHRNPTGQWWWVWRRPFDGSDTPIDPPDQTPRELAYALLSGFIDPLELNHN